MKESGNANETSVSEVRERLMDEGRSAALRGEPMPVASPAGSGPVLSADPNLAAPEDFLRAVYDGILQTRGALRKKEQGDYETFLAEAAEDAGAIGQLPFFKSVASAWGRFSSGRASSETAGRVARFCAGHFSKLWDLGIGARLTKSILEASLHLTDVPAQIRAAGWLDGEILRLRAAMPPLLVMPAGDPPFPSPLHFLEKNRYTILVKTLKENDPHYPRLVSQTLPRMLDALRSLIARMRTSSDPSVLEAADYLGGSPDKGRRGNINSLINYAISSARLLDYVREIESRFATGDIVREIEASIRQLGGKTEQSEYLRANKSSIISRSIHHGTLDHKLQMKKALDKRSAREKVRIQSLESENRRLKDIVAELILTRR